MGGEDDDTLAEEDPVEIAVAPGKEPTEPGNTGPWLADNQSRDLNN